MGHQHLHLPPQQPQVSSGSSSSTPLYSLIGIRNGNDCHHKNDGEGNSSMALNPDPPLPPFPLSPMYFPLQRPSRAVGEHSDGGRERPRQQGRRGGRSPRRRLHAAPPHQLPLCSPRRQGAAAFMSMQGGTLLFRHRDIDSPPFHEH